MLELAQAQWKRALEGAAPHKAALKSGQSPWKRQKQRRPFGGDLAIAGLRNQLALAPQWLPEPPPPLTEVKGRLVLRLAAIAVVSTVSVIGYQLGSSPQASLHLPPHSRQSGGPRSASEQQAPPANPLQPATLPLASPTVERAVMPQSDAPPQAPTGPVANPLQSAALPSVSPTVAKATAPQSDAPPRAPARPVAATAGRSDVNLLISPDSPLFQEFQEFMAWRVRNHKGQ